MAKILHPYEERILKILARGKRELTTLQVSEFSGISYNTTRNYLEKLKTKGKVKKVDLGNRIYWNNKQ